MTPHASPVSEARWMIAATATSTRPPRFLFLDDDELRELRDAIDRAAPTQTSMEIPA